MGYDVGRIPPPPPPMYGQKPKTPRPSFAGYQPTHGPENPVPAGQGLGRKRRSLEEEWDDYKRTTPPELRDEEAPTDLLIPPTPGQKQTS